MSVEGSLDKIEIEIVDVNGSNLSSKLGPNYNVYVRNFQGVKVGRMKGYTKPYLNKKFDSEKNVGLIGKSTTDIAKGLNIDKRMIIISGIIPSNNEMNKKANGVNDQLKEICQNATIGYLD